jgi:hypothetical protein
MSKPVSKYAVSTTGAVPHVIPAAVGATVIAGAAVAVAGAVVGVAGVGVELELHAPATSARAASPPRTLRDWLKTGNTGLLLLGQLDPERVAMFVNP